MKKTKINTTQINNNTNNANNANNANKKIINWSKYSNSLENRGNFTVLLNVTYLNNTAGQTGRAGHPFTYSDALILFLAQLREFMRLPLRQTIGMAKFILAQAAPTLQIQLPSYITLSRRLSKLNIPTHLDRINFASPIIFLPDSTGLKISGEGEWKVKKHGADKRRTWVKVHLGVDCCTGAIVAISTTKAHVHDGSELINLLDHVSANLPEAEISDVIADGAYGSKANYAIARKNHLNLLVPPPKNAVWHGDIKDGELVDDPKWRERNSYVRDCWKLGRDEWKKQSGYHKRSLAETAMFRLKRSFGSRLRSRTSQNQEAEVKIRVSLLNLFTSYGLPEYAT